MGAWKQASWEKKATGTEGCSAGSEIKTLAALKEAIEQAVADAEGYILSLVERLGEDARLRLMSPSVRVEGGKCGDLLYMRGPLEANFKQNLDKTLTTLMHSGATVWVTDPGVPAPVKLIVKLV